MTAMRALPFVLIVSASCSGFKSGTADGGADASSASDAQPASDAIASGEGGGPNSGPGPRGALPTGYCCAKNEDCRYRSCVDVGGGVKMCSDICRSQDACDGGLPGFVCMGGSQFVDGQCMPSAPMAKCVPADRFTHGTKPLRACCTPTYNGANGNECEGGHCAENNGVWMCSNACSKASDCPGPFLCTPLTSTYSECIVDGMGVMCTM